MILKMPYDTQIKRMLEMLNWMSVKQRIVYNTLRFIYKIENEEMPQYLKKFLIKKEAQSSYALRNNNDYKLPDFKKEISQNSLFYNGLKEFNKLRNTHIINNLQQFKNHCKNYVKIHY